jgi:hypothetical protein
MLQEPLDRKQGELMAYMISSLRVRPEFALRALCPYGRRQTASLVLAKYMQANALQVATQDFCCCFVH